MYRQVLDLYATAVDYDPTSTGEKLLVDAGSISHNQAIEKAKSEYKKIM